MKIKIQLQVLLIALLPMSLAATTPKAEQYTLDNGLTIILCERHETPTVFGGVVVRVGAKDDPADATGLAHYMEHMLFKGTTQMGTTDWESEKPYIDSIFMMYDLLATKTEEAARDSIKQKINQLSVKAGEYAIPNEMDNLLSGFGSTNINAGTAPDWTAYYNEFPPSQMQKWMELYAHRFEEPVFRLFQSELETVYEEKNMYNDFFFYPMLEEFMESLYKVHPYGQQSTIGTMEHLKNPSLSKMKEFYEAWYVPGNMALMLIGDFSIEEVKPMIASTFGKWEAREFPKHVEWKEKPLEGRELKEVKMSPIKMELLGYLTIPSSHPDKVVMDVCNYLISNEGKTGLLDRLVLKNELLEAQMITMPCNDLLSTILFVIPKLVGQSLDEAEQLALGELNKLASGEFPDELLQIAKMEIARTYQLDLENSMDLGIYMLDAWYDGKTVEEVFNYPAEIEKVSREDIMRFASKYYGDDYLAFQSKMGSADKEKIDKPGYDPVLGNREAKSKFATHLETIPSMQPVARFVDFENDIATTKLSNGNQVYVVSNPENEIATLKIKYGVGMAVEPMLEQASSLMNFATPVGMSLDSLKTSFALLGCSYNFSSDRNYTTISLTGFEENIEKAVTLLAQILKDPQIEESRIDNILEDVKATRKAENTDADAVADALLEYATYHDLSTYLNRPGIKDLKKAGVSGLSETYQQVFDYEAEIHYTGNLSSTEIKALLEKDVVWSQNPKPSSAPYVREMVDYDTDNLIIVNKPKASQSKIYFYVNANPYKTDEQAQMDAFNFYFGGGFSGLVLQEIRESRSLAYSAGASYQRPSLTNTNARFIGYVGTQDDKTVIAVDVFLELMREMPQYPDRMDYLRDYLVEASYTARPQFRNLSEEYVTWKNLGYESDPNEVLVQQFEKMDFSSLVEFYEKNLKDEVVTICIVGDKKRMDIKSLENFGKISYLKEKKLYSK